MTKSSKKIAKLVLKIKAELNFYLGLKNNRSSQINGLGMVKYKESWLATTQAPSKEIWLHGAKELINKS